MLAFWVRFCCLHGGFRGFLLAVFCVSCASDFLGFGVFNFLVPALPKFLVLVFWAAWVLVLPSHSGLFVSRF